MPKVTYIIDGEPTTVEFEVGALPYSNHGKPESFLDVAKSFGVPLEHACGGNCACTTCHVIIREGAQNLSDMDDDEADRPRDGVRRVGRHAGSLDHRGISTVTSPWTTAWHPSREYGVRPGA